MNERADTDLDRLVRDGAWLKRFVGTLVSAQDVDDVTQASWLAAVEGRSPVRGGIAVWLRGVAGNVARMLHRSERRRARAVQRLPKRGNAPSAADAVAGLEVQRAVSDALLALPEPTRTIVLLCYHEGLSPAAIATRVGLRADAVRQRLHRGREAVCERLQQRFGADWRGSPAVAAFVRDARNAMPLAGVAALAATALAGTALVATSLAVGLRADAPAVDRVARAEVSAPRREPTASLAAAPSVPERVLVAEHVPGPPPPPATPPKIEVRGRLLAAEDGTPLAGAFIRGSDGKGPLEVTSGGDGRFVFAYAEQPPNGPMRFDAEARCQRWCKQPSSSVDLGDIAMTLGYEVSGRVVDEKGTPLPDVCIRTGLEGEVPDGSAPFTAMTDADGKFAFRALAPAGPLGLCEDTPGIAIDDVEVEVFPRAPNHFVLRARRLRSISGVVIDNDGRPCANVQLVVFPTAEPNGTVYGRGTPSAPDGTFELFDFSERHAEGFVGVGDHAAHELVGPRVRCEWGAHGVRIAVRPLIPVRLFVVEAETGKPVTTFTAFSLVWTPFYTVRTGMQNPTELPDGRYAFEGLPANAQVIVFAADPDRAPVVTTVVESMRTQPEVRVPLPTLQPYALELVDEHGAPVASEFDLIDRRGVAAPPSWADYVTGKQAATRVLERPYRVSAGSTDPEGKGTLRAPTDQRDLALRLPRGKQNVWLPVRLPANGTPLRLVVPD